MNKSSWKRPAVVSQVESALAMARFAPLGVSSLSCDDPLRTVTGASVTVCLFDSISLWSGLRQVLMPATDHHGRQDAMLRADAALEDLFCSLCGAAGINQGDRSERARIKAKIFGGAEVTPDGLLSVAFSRSWLGTRQVPVAAESVGGSCQRELIVVPERSSVYCRSLSFDEAFLSEELAALTASAPPANKIELF